MLGVLNQCSGWSRHPLQLLQMRNQFNECDPGGAQAPV